MLMAWMDGIRRTRQWNRRSIEALAKWNSRKVEDGGRQVDVCSDCIFGLIAWYTRTADKEGHADIFFKPACFPRRQTVLANMVAIVGGVDNVGIVELVAGLKTCNQRINKLVHALQSTQTLAVEMIVVIDGRLVLLGEILDPVDSTRLRQLITDNSECFGVSHLVWVEIFSAGDLHIPEQ